MPSPGSSPECEGPRLELLGVPLDRCTRAEALALCIGALQRGPAPEDPLRVVTLNPEMVMQARRDVRLRQAIASAGLVLADGAGVVWASRRLRQPVPQRLAGVDLLGQLAESAASEGCGVFLLGAAPGVAEEAGRRLQLRHPGLRVSGCLSGSPAEQDADQICSLIRRSGAVLLAVAFGVPEQELWLAGHLRETGAALGIGVGGSLDYIAGRVRRAPEPMRRVGLEWLFRLARQPWRLPRMLRGAQFFLEVLRTPAREAG